VIPKFGLYTITDKHFQSSFARRYHLPHILPSLPCTCLRLPLSPLIDQEGHHYTTGCPLQGVRQVSRTSLINAILYILCHAGCPAPLEDFAEMMRLKGNVLILRFSKLLIILVLCYLISHLSSPLLILKILSTAANLCRWHLPQYPRPSNSRNFCTVTQRENDKYLRICVDNGVSFLLFIVESNGCLHPKAQEFLRDLVHQVSFYLISIPSSICSLWCHYYLFSVSLSFTPPYLSPSLTQNL